MKFWFGFLKIVNWTHLTSHLTLEPLKHWGFPEKSMIGSHWINESRICLDIHPSTNYQTKILSSWIHSGNHNVILLTHNLKPHHVRSFDHSQNSIDRDFIISEMFLSAIQQFAWNVWIFVRYVNPFLPDQLPD
jgi:hypothetical protein